jgi:flagellar hook-length control protein FliK
MSPLPITSSSQAAAAAQADAASGASASDSDFGPILQAASGSPAGEPTRNPSQSAPRDRQNGTRPQDDGVVSDPNQAPAKPDGRRVGRTGAGPQPDAAAAAAAAASLIAPAVHAQLDAAAATKQDTGVAAASSDDIGSGSPTIEASGAAVGRAADATSGAQDAGANAAVATLQSMVGANVQTRLDLQRAAETQASRPQAVAKQLDRLGAGQARTPIQAADDGTGAPSEAAADALDPGSGLVATLAGSALSVSQGAQAVAQALASVGALSGSSAPDATALHAGSGAVAGADPPGAASVAAGGSFGPATSYAPETRASVATPVGQPGFSQEFSDRVLVLTRGGVQTAQISLEPAGLGPVGVSIQMHGHEATLAFTAAHQATRDALEAALPRLREMFASSGMQLTDASVGGRAQPDWSGPGNSRSEGWPRAERSLDAAAVPADQPGATARTAALRLVDIYA